MKKINAVLLFLSAVLFLSTECFAMPKSAVLMDKNSGRVFYELNMEERLPMASTTKIMTALIALEEEKIDDYFTVESSAIKVEGSSMGLVEGDKATLRILAMGMLLSSGNDAANAAAVNISGSAEKFAKLMNKRAKEMGLFNTSFETPSGLDGKNHYSTAFDMAILAKNALQNPDFAEICGAESIRTEFGNPPYPRLLLNHNRLLSEFEGATGVKTGFTKKAGRCLVSSAERNGVSLICVTLGCPDDWNFHKSLYNEFFGKLEAVSLEEKVPEKKIHVCGGDSEEVLLLPGPCSAAFFEEEKEKTETVICVPEFVFAPIEKGEVLGKAIFRLDGKTIAETPLVAEKEIGIIRKEENIFSKIKGFFS